MIDFLFTPKNFLVAELDRVGVKIIDKKSRCCACIECGEKWNVGEPIGDNLPEGFWQCPNLCNVLSLQIRSSGPDWVLWELPDGTPFIGNFDDEDNVELYDLQMAKGGLYKKLSEFLEDGGDPLATGLEWDIHEHTGGTVFVCENYEDAIYTLKPASEQMKKIYEKGKNSQFSVAGDLGMHT